MKNRSWTKFFPIALLFTFCSLTAAAENRSNFLGWHYAAGFFSSVCCGIIIHFSLPATKLASAENLVKGGLKKDYSQAVRHHWEFGSRFREWCSRGIKTYCSLSHKRIQHFILMSMPKNYSPKLAMPTLQGLWDKSCRVLLSFTNWQLNDRQSKETLNFGDSGGSRWFFQAGLSVPNTCYTWMKRTREMKTALGRECTALRDREWKFPHVHRIVDFQPA